MKRGLLFGLVALVGGCSSGGATTPIPTPGADAQAPAAVDDAGPVDATGLSAADWVGDWTCTAGGNIGGAALPNNASTATIVQTGAGTLAITATIPGSGNPSCTVTATLTSSAAATYPDGQSCSLTNPVSATLTITDGSVATVQPGQLTTKQNVVVSNSPGFDGQTGTLTSTCTRP